MSAPTAALLEAGGAPARGAAAPAFDFALPPALEAQEPPEARGLRRDGVRLLVTRRRDGAVAHAAFADLPRYLAPGDLLVVNDSATIPAALAARRANGDPVALHLSTRLAAGLWVVEPRAIRAGSGETLDLPGGAQARLLVPYPGSTRLWIARLDLRAPWLEYLRSHGRPIAYPYVRGRWPLEM